MNPPGRLPKDKRLLVAGGLLVFIVLVHVAAIFIGPEAFDYLDAAELAEAMRSGDSAMPITLTMLVSAVFALFAAYALSGGGALRKLPRLRSVLLVIAGIFTLRGLGVLWFAYLVLIDSPEAIPREIGFSLLSLALGVLIFLGRRDIPK